MFDNYAKAKLSKLTKKELIDLCKSENVIVPDSCSDDNIVDLIMYIKKYTYGDDDNKLEKTDVELLKYIVIYYLGDVKELKKYKESDISNAKEEIKRLTSNTPKEIKCEAIKKDGDKCSISPSYKFENKLYCGSHCKDKNRIELICEGKIKNGTKCSIFPSYTFNNKTFCKTHLKMIKDNVDTDEITSNTETKKEIKRKNIPKAVKGACWNENIGPDNASGQCFTGCLNIISQQNFQVGHIIAVSNGGSDELSNLKPICQQCNTSMGDQNMDEFIKQYGFKKKKKEELLIDPFSQSSSSSNIMIDMNPVNNDLDVFFVTETLYDRFIKFLKYFHDRITFLNKLATEETKKNNIEGRNLIWEINNSGKNLFLSIINEIKTNLSNTPDYSNFHNNVYGRLDCNDDKISDYLKQGLEHLRYFQLNSENIVNSYIDIILLDNYKTDDKTKIKLYFSKLLLPLYHEFKLPRIMNSKKDVNEFFQQLDNKDENGNERRPNPLKQFYEYNHTYNMISDKDIKKYNEFIDKMLVLHKNYPTINIYEIKVEKITKNKKREIVYDTPEDF